MQKFIDNWSATLLASITEASLSLSVEPVKAALLTGLAGGAFYRLTLVELDGSGAEVDWDVVQVTAVAGGVLTASRTSTARSWTAGTLIEARLTAAGMGELRDSAGGPGPQGEPGASAYEVAVGGGFVGTEAQWLASLVGPEGPQGPQGETGPQGAAGAGLNILGTLATEGDLPLTGNAGEAYLIAGDLWVWSGSDWVNAGQVQGPQGPAGAPGTDGADGADGTPGASAYQVAVAAGFVGTEAQWLASLVGPQGPAGAAGADGADGADGVNGAPGSAGASAYQVAVAAGFVGTEAQWLASLVGPQGPAGPSGATAPQSIIIACSDETTALTAGSAKVTFRMPYAFTLSAVRASLTTAQTSGAILTVDINEGGTSILSTKLTIDNGEKTSTTAAAAAVISDSAMANDAEITIDIDQVGDGTAKGLKVYLIGVPS